MMSNFDDLLPPHVADDGGYGWTTTGTNHPGTSFSIVLINN